MEGEQLPIVSFGKYKDKSVLELLADKKYVEWLKQQSWFANQKQIYNIVVHQTISTTTDSKTPEHNKLQNLFLEKQNQRKLLSQLVNIRMPDIIKHLLKDEDIIRCFNTAPIPESEINLDQTTIKFEDKFNWDFVLYYSDQQSFSMLSNSDNELADREKYKEQYDKEESKKYNDNLALFDKLIEIRNKLDEENIKEYEQQMRDYTRKCENYENDLKNYLQQKPLNEKEIVNYKNILNQYNSERDRYEIEQKKLICKEFGINYENYVNWNIPDDSEMKNPHFTYHNSNLDKDNSYSIYEKKQLREIIYSKLNPFITEYERINIKPKCVRELQIPKKPSAPHLYDSNMSIHLTDKSQHISSYFNKKIMPKFKEIDDLFEMNKDKITIINNSMTYTYSYQLQSHNIQSIIQLNEIRHKYVNEYLEKYDNNFDKHYEIHRTQYYKNIINKYNNEDNIIYIEKKSEQYELSVEICHLKRNICCELKPILSDDYPVVLRKLKTQIELTKNDKTKYFGENPLRFILIIGDFTSIHVSKEQLITIFKQSNIKIIFTDDIFDANKLTKYTNPIIKANWHETENRCIEENRILTNDLIQTQQKLLQAEEKINRLEEEIKSLKNKKQNKTINNYFVKK
jgi:hypothetical protein